MVTGVSKYKTGVETIKISWLGKLKWKILLKLQFSKKKINERNMENLSEKSPEDILENGTYRKFVYLKFPEIHL